MEMEIDRTLSRTELIEKIYEYLNAEDIEMCSEKISMRDLRDILANNFKNLNNAKKRLTNPHFLCSLYNIIGKTCFEEVNSISKNEDVISFCLELNNLIHIAGPLYRRYGEGEKFYYNSNYNNREVAKLLQRNSDKIERIFDEIELLKDIPLSFNLNVKYDIFFGYIIYDYRNEPSACLGVNGSFVSDEIITMEYVDSPSIKSITNRYMEELLGKIPVDVEQLPVSMQSLIGDELKKRETIKPRRKFNC